MDDLGVVHPLTLVQEAPVPLTVEPGLWQLDPARSTVTFKHKAMWGLATVNGVFTSVSAEGQVQPDGTARGTLTIDAASLDTKQAKRDTHLRSADFFHAEQYPVLTFAARNLVPSTDDTVKVEGALTVRETTRPLSFTAHAQTSGQDEVTLSAELPVDRADFGLNWNQMGMLRGVATVSVSLRFTRKPA
jgi:polyisoprenoid-binding protein YceI